MTERAGGAATATKAAAKKASVQVTPEAYDRVIMVANHYGMTQRGAASLMLIAGGHFAAGDPGGRDRGQLAAAGRGHARSAGCADVRRRRRVALVGGVAGERNHRGEG